MTADFVLFLSPEGIALAHRQPAGHWAFIGDTAVDVPDLAASLADLRRAGEARGGPDFPTILILPDDQILYREFEGLGGSADVVARLEGLTPYKVADLAHDWRDIGGGRAKLAVVARETLAEASGFARSHGFNDVAFAAAPPAEKFPGVPVFGTADGISLPEFPETGLAFGPDGWTETKAPASGTDTGTGTEPAPQAAPPLPDNSTDAAVDDGGADTDTPGASTPETGTETPADPSSAQSRAEDTSVARDPDEAPSDPPPTPIKGDDDKIQPTTRADDDAVPAPQDAAPEDDSPLRMPAGFAARRGRATTPDAETGRLTGARAPRFVPSLEAASEKANPSLIATPEAGPTRPTGLTAPSRTAEPDRNVSLVEAVTTSDDHSRRVAQPTGPARDDPADDTTDYDAPIMGGLLARGETQKSGPSFRTGLILTLVLLLVMALIAAWAALFAPESNLARLLGREAPEFDLAAPGPPSRVTLPATVIAPASPDRDAEVAGLPPRTAPTSEMAEPGLPDIDAEMLELGPAPVDPATRLPSIEDTEAFYASNGIWQRPPATPEPVEPDEIDMIYVASIDPTIRAVDALALPVPDIAGLSEPIAPVASPAPFGTTFALGPDGLVLPTQEGALTADGVRVVAGLPPVVPGQRPGDGGEAAAEAIEDAAVDAANAALAEFSPTQRPADLAEQRERQVLGGFTSSELAGLRPTERPPSVQQVALAVRAAATAASDVRSDPALATPEAGTDATPGATFDAAVLGGAASTAENVADATPLAVASSRLPRTRPGAIAALADRAEQEEEEDEPQVQTASAPAAAATVQPSIPSNASVSRAATMSNSINLRQLNLIGVSGTQSNRRALLRLPSGRFVRVAVGDSIDGGQVAAIGERSLQYIKNGRNVVLEIPG